ncbi:Uncharacterised protein [Riemerella anatipestifer]|nr:Uncharacterised protein [Riemerella anatipestifer]
MEIVLREGEGHCGSSFYDKGSELCSEPLS